MQELAKDIAALPAQYIHELQPLLQGLAVRCSQCLLLCVGRKARKGHSRIQ